MQKGRKGLVKTCNINFYDCSVDSPFRGSCKELYDDGLKTSGYYRTHRPGEGEMVVFCDMSTEVSVNNRSGYGWTVILRRLDSSTPSFNRSWQEYRNGFGCLNDSFWFGLQKIKHLVSYKLPGCTNTTHQLYIAMEGFHPTRPYNSVFYNFFSIGDESENYKLNIDIDVVGGGSSYNSTLSGGTHDALDKHSGLQFSTYDKDNDMNSGVHCAESRGGGWWYRNCIHSHLTGKFYSTGVMPASANDGIIWEGVTTGVESLKRAVMAIRPICND